MIPKCLNYDSFDFYDFYDNGFTEEFLCENSARSASLC